MRDLVVIVALVLLLPHAGAEEAMPLEALVLNRAMPRGAALTCDHLRLVARPMQSIPNGALAAPCNLAAGVVLRRPLGAGDVLRAADFGQPPAVTAHAEVRLRARVGAVQIERSGMALNDAQAGEQVLVRLAGSARSVRGTVTGPNLVEVGELP